MSQDKGRKLEINGLPEIGHESSDFLESLRGLGEKALGVVKRVRNGVVSTVKPLGSAAAGVAALGAVGATSLPDSANAESFVTAGANPGNGQMYVAQDVPPGGDVTVTPDVYNVPIPAGATVFGLTRIDDSHFVRGVSIPAEQRAETQILELDGSGFNITGTVDTGGRYTILPDGSVLITIDSGLWKFNPSDPQGTLEQVVEGDLVEYFQTSASFTDASGNQCHLVAGQEDVIRLVAETPEGVTETLIPIPPEVLLSGIWGLRIGDDGRLVINNGGRAYIALFNPNNPQALIDDIQDAVLVHEATVDSINDAVSVNGRVVVGEGDTVTIYTEDGASMARNDLEIQGQQGFEVDGDLLHVATSSSVVTIDLNAKEVIRTVTGEVDAPFGAPGGLAVIPDTIPPEIQEQFSANPPVNGIQWAASPGVPAPVAGGEPNTLEVSIPTDALLSGDTYFYFGGPAPVPELPSPEEVVTIHFSAHDVVIAGFGTVGGLQLDQQSGDLDQGVTGELEIFEDGRLEAQPSRIVMEEIEVVEGANGPEERVVQTFDFGTFGEVTGQTVEGDDDDDTGGNSSDDDDTGTVPGGCEESGCYISAVRQPNGAWLISLILAPLAAGRRRIIRIEKA